MVKSHSTSTTTHCQFKSSCIDHLWNEYSSYYRQSNMLSILINFNRSFGHTLCDYLSLFYLLIYLLIYFNTNREKKFDMWENWINDSSIWNCRLNEMKMNKSHIVSYEIFTTCRTSICVLCIRQKTTFTYGAHCSIFTLSYLRIDSCDFVSLIGFNARSVVNLLLF